MTSTAALTWGRTPTDRTGPGRSFAWGRNGSLPPGSPRRDVEALPVECVEPDHGEIFSRGSRAPVISSWNSPGRTSEISGAVGWREYPGDGRHERCPGTPGERVSHSLDGNRPGPKALWTRAIRGATCSLRTRRAGRRAARIRSVSFEWLRFGFSASKPPISSGFAWGRPRAELRRTGHRSMVGRKKTISGSRVPSVPDLLFARQSNRERRFLRDPLGGSSKALVARRNQKVSSS